MWTLKEMPPVKCGTGPKHQHRGYCQDSQNNGCSEDITDCGDGKEVGI